MIVPVTGWSESSGRPHTAQNSAEDLYNLLQAASVPAPYVLMGHSYGGYTTRVFHDMYPDSVIGIVLAESGHQKQWERLPEVFVSGAQEQAKQLAAGEMMAKLGITRHIIPNDPYLSEEHQGAYRAAMGLSRSFEAFGSEFATSTISAHQSGDTQDFGDKPLAVISAENSLEAFAVMDETLPFDEGNVVWAELQRELVGLSTNSVQLISTTGDHYIHGTHPELVLEGVDWVLEQLSG